MLNGGECPSGCGRAGKPCGDASCYPVCDDLSLNAQVFEASEFMMEGTTPQDSRMHVLTGKETAEEKSKYRPPTFNDADQIVAGGWPEHLGFAGVCMSRGRYFMYTDQPSRIAFRNPVDPIGHKGSLDDYQIELTAAEVMGLAGCRALGLDERQVGSVIGHAPIPKVYNVRAKGSYVFNISDSRRQEIIAALSNQSQRIPGIGMDRRLGIATELAGLKVTDGKIEAKPIELAVGEAMALALAESVKLVKGEVTCKGGQCFSIGESGMDTLGKYLFIAHPDRLQQMIDVLENPDVEIEGLTHERRQWLTGELAKLKKMAPLTTMRDQGDIWWKMVLGNLPYGVLALGATIGIFLYIDHKAGQRHKESMELIRGERAEVAGSKVELKDLTKDRTAELREELRTTGRFSEIYHDEGAIGQMCEAMRNSNPKYNNFAMVGETDSGKSYGVKTGLAQAILVEEYLLEHPDQETRITAAGLPRIPEEHRAWALEFLRYGQTLGEPGMRVFVLDMRAFRAHGAVFKDLDDKMIAKFLAPFEEMARQGIKVVFYIDESREAAEQPKLIGEERARASLMQKLKEVVERHPNISISHGTTTEEFAEHASDPTQTVRYQPVHVREATPAELIYRLRANGALLASYGVTSVSDEVMKAVVVMSRELKPSASYNASTARLYEAVLMYAQSRSIQEVNFDTFRQYYAAKHEAAMGPLPIGGVDLDANIAAITEQINLRNERTFAVLQEFQRGNVSPQFMQELRGLRNWRHIPRKVSELAAGAGGGDGADGSGGVGGSGGRPDTPEARRAAELARFRRTIVENPQLGYLTIGMGDAEFDAMVRGLHTEFSALSPADRAEVLLRGGIETWIAGQVSGRAGRGGKAGGKRADERRDPDPDRDAREGKGAGEGGPGVKDGRKKGPGSGGRGPVGK